MKNNHFPYKMSVFFLLLTVLNGTSFSDTKMFSVENQLHNIYSRNYTFSTDQISLKEALEFTVTHHPEIQIQAQQIAFARGEILIEAGEFDPTIEGSINRGSRKELEFDTDEDDNPVSFEFDTSFMDFSVDVSKRFRGGQTANLGLLVDYEDIEDSGTGATSESELFIELTQPLMKNRGIEVTGASEKAAKIDLQARELDLRGSVSSGLLSTTEAYWEYLEALKILEIRREAAYPIENLVAKLKSMQGLRHNNLETEEAEAELYSRNTALVEAKQEYIFARHKLGLAMGLISYNDIESLPEPQDDFIAINTTDLNTIRELVPVYLRRAEHQRASILSLKRQKDSVLILRDAAKRGFEPQLDLVARYGYLGIEDDTSVASSFGAVRNNSDPTWLIGGVFSYPLGNNAAKGELAQQKSLLSELNLRLYNNLREVSSSIVVTVEELINLAKETELTKKSISLYQNALIRQKEDLLGNPDLGALLDFITIQDDLIDEKINQIEQKNQYSKAIAVLAYETGQILESGSEISINVENLKKIH